MTLMRPTSTGNGLNGPMRLVAMLLMLWDDDTHKGRIEWDYDQIADRTGLSVSQVEAAIANLRAVNLVRETAAGPKLTWDEFERRTLPSWQVQRQDRELRHAMRPKPSSVSPHTPEDGDGNGNPEVARRQAEGGC